MEKEPIIFEIVMNQPIPVINLKGISLQGDSEYSRLHIKHVNIEISSLRAGLRGQVVHGCFFKRRIKTRYQQDPLSRLGGNCPGIIVLRKKYRHVFFRCPMTGIIGLGLFFNALDFKECESRSSAVLFSFIGE